MLVEVPDHSLRVTQKGPPKRTVCDHGIIYCFVSRGSWCMDQTHGNFSSMLKTRAPLKQSFFCKCKLCYKRTLPFVLSMSSSKNSVSSRILSSMLLFPIPKLRRVLRANRRTSNHSLLLLKTIPAEEEGRGKTWLGLAGCKMNGGSR